MNNEIPTNPGQTVPAWFADNTDTPPSPPTHSGLKKRLPLIIGALLVVVAIGIVVWVISAANAAKVSAFQSFDATYEALETDLVDFDDITEPENLNTDTLISHWDAFQSALRTLPTAPFYKDNVAIIESVKTKSATYETYVTKVLPPLTHYLVDCSSIGDETMYSSVCRGYIQTAINAGDTLTADDLKALLAILTQMEQTNTLTRVQTDSARELQEKLFSVGATIQTTVRPSMVELGKKVGVEIQATNF